MHANAGVIAMVDSAKQEVRRAGQDVVPCELDAVYGSSRACEKVYAGRIIRVGVDFTIGYGDCGRNSTGCSRTWAVWGYYIDFA